MDALRRECYERITTRERFLNASPTQQTKSYKVSETSESKTLKTQIYHPDHSIETIAAPLFWIRHTNKPAIKPRRVSIPNTIPRTTSTGNCDGFAAPVEGGTVGVEPTRDVALGTTPLEADPPKLTEVDKVGEISVIGVFDAR